MKKFVALLAACALVASLAGCVDPAPAPAVPPGGMPQVAEPTSNNGGGASAGSEASGSSASYAAQAPCLVTSGGQSADYQMIGTVMGKLGLEYTINNLATSADLGSAKTLIVVVGGSSKGLGAAGIDADQELARVDELINGAKSAGLSVIAMHTGGTARRGDLSDKFITPIFEKSDYAVVVSSGDEDGLMAGICQSKSIPMDAIASISEVSGLLPAVFSGNGGSAPAAGGSSAAISAQSPCLVTSGGQSADYQMIGTVMGKLGLDYSINNLATSADLGDAKTLIVVVGGSSKGLGAAGIDADQELARVAELIDGAKAAGLKVIAMHTGGSARRGDLSDKFITPIFEKADYAIVVTSGDEDGLMAGICKDKGIPMDAIGSISDVTKVLPPVFNGGGAPASAAPAAGSSSSSGPISTQGPSLVTSGGQSADYQMIGTVMGKLGLDYSINNLATSADLGDAKTLIVVVGGSSKGLGAAGIDADQELARVAELIDGAKAAGLKVIAMHTGGSARRGDLSDKFITPIFEKADYAIVVTSGDEDGLMAGICKDKGIPMDAIGSISEVTKVLPAVFS